MNSVGENYDNPSLQTIVQKELIRIALPLIFLGAGASAPLGIPTMSQMVDQFGRELVEHVKDPRPESVLFEKVKDFVSALLGFEDLESIFTVIKAISENSRTSELGIVAAYAASRNKPESLDSTLASNTEKLLATSLLLRYRGFIQRKCQLAKGKEIKIKNVFDGLFESVTDFCNAKNLKIYTTNYDNIIETYCNSHNVQYNDGFEKHDSMRSVLNPDLLESSDMLRLVKLHGSLGWFVQADKMIVKAQLPVHIGWGAGDNVVSEEEMLFPIQQKDMYRYPWFDFLHSLKRELSFSRYWFVIGYSFHDEYVKGVFLDSFRRKRDKVMVLISPHASSIARKIFPEFRQQILSIDGYFGSADVDRELRNLAGSILDEVVESVVRKFMVEVDEGRISSECIPSKSEVFQLIEGLCGRD